MLVSKTADRLNGLMITIVIIGIMVCCTDDIKVLCKRFGTNMGKHS